MDFFARKGFLRVPFSSNVSGTVRFEIWESANDCSSPNSTDGWYTRAKYEICRLAPSNYLVGRIIDPTYTNIATVFSNASDLIPEAKVKLQWENNNDYCGTISKAKVRLFKEQSDGSYQYVSGIANTDTWVDFTVSNGFYYLPDLSLEPGKYRFIAAVQEPTYDGVSENIVHGYSDAAFSQTDYNAITAPDYKSLDGVSSPQANNPYSGEFEVVMPCRKGEISVINGYVSGGTPLVDYTGNISGLTSLAAYDRYYEIKKGQTITLEIESSFRYADHWYEVVNDGASGLTSPAALTYKGVNKTHDGFIYVVQLTSAADVEKVAYSVYVNQKSGISDLYDKYGCPAQENAKTRITVGGQDASIVKHCLSKLPDDLAQSGTFVSGEPTYQVLLDNFSYTVQSDDAVIIGEGLHLIEGAQIIVTPPSSTTADTDPEVAGPAAQNFVQLTTYNEDLSIAGQSRSYFDQMGRPTESQYKQLSTAGSLEENTGTTNYKQQTWSATVWGVSTLRDRYERDALATLPYPVATNYSTTTVNDCGVNVQNGETAYFSRQSMSLWADNYRGIPTYQLFDGQMHIPVPVNNINHKLVWYYSGQNLSSGAIDGYSAFREGNTPYTYYPYSQNIYKEDGTNEVIATVSPGDAYRYEVSPTAYLVPARNGNAFQHLGYSQLKDQTIAAQKTEKESYPYLSEYLDLYALIFFGDKNADEKPVLSTFVNFITQQESVDPRGVKSIVTSDAAGQTLISELQAEDNIVSYNFYDTQGRLRVSISPNGRNAYLAGTPYADIDKTVMEYDYRGRLVAQTDNDRGRTEFKYRNDGSIRFSQNALQRSASPERFSYICYDVWGRMAEGGEYTSYNSAAQVAYTFATADAIVENTDSDDSDGDIGGLPVAGLAERVHTYYDGEEQNISGLQLIGYTAPENVRGAVSSTVKYSQGIAKVSQTWYSYDARGRTSFTVMDIAGLDSKKLVQYCYNTQGGLESVAYQNGQWDAFYHEYTYDKDGRMTVAKAGETAGSLPVQAGYTYYLHGPLKSLTIGNGFGGASAFEKQEFLYTIEGQLKAINHPEAALERNNGLYSGANPLFSEVLEYYSGDYLKNGILKKYISGLYNGLPLAIQWRNYGFSYVTGNPGAYTYAPSAWVYTYNKRNWLTGARFAQLSSDYHTLQTAQSSYAESFTYDANGNMQTLNRKDRLGADYDNGTLAYGTANTNRLTAATGTASVQGDYTYNSLGQLTNLLKAGNKSYQYSYNPAGLVNRLTVDNQTTDYVYGEGGNRVTKLQTGKQSFYVYDADGNVLAVYEKELNNGTLKVSLEQPLYGSGRLGMAHREFSATATDLDSWDGLNPTPVAYTTSYEVADRLGNVRVVGNKNNLDANAPVEIKAFDYYAYGSYLPFRGGAYRYGYQGQYAESEPESQDAQGNATYHFDLREYDAVVPRWNSTDPYGEFDSPYMAMGNNPVVNTDPDGGCTEGPCIGLTGGFAQWRQQQRNQNTPKITFSESHWYDWFNEVPEPGSYMYGVALSVGALNHNNFGTSLDLYTKSPNWRIMVEALLASQYNNRYGNVGGIAAKATIKTPAKTSTSLVTKYPAVAEVAGTAERRFLMPGLVIDRYGPLWGKWFSIPGTSYGARSIPPGLSPYTKFKVLKPFEVQKSLSSPGMFSIQTGFGIQFQSPVGADILIKRGIIAPF